MTSFLQFHILTSYPPSNLNRDDLGRPKTAVMGGVTRLRISSQSLKRHWRVSDLFQQELQGNLGQRTKDLGVLAFRALCSQGVKEKDANEWAKKIAEQFGALKKGSSRGKGEKENPEVSLQIEQLVHVSPEEYASIQALIEVCVQEHRAPKDSELELLRSAQKAVDIGMFGRMLASKPKFNVEAAVQVAHALTTHAVAVESDYFTAVDDLNLVGQEMDRGAAHIGEVEFGAGVFYLYVCVDQGLLESNLQGDAALAQKAVAALLDAMTQISPSGKQNSFAHQSRASYVLIEKGKQQPRSLSLAFLKPVLHVGKGLLLNSIEALESTREKMDKAYGACSEDSAKMNLLEGLGSLEELRGFLKK